jgi:O-acetylserine/cysteine efflux transporter
MWSNSFIAVSLLLGGERRAAGFDWLTLTVARFAPAALVAILYCAVVAPRQSLLALRRHPLRLVACGALAVPCYNFALYYAQQHGVPAPVASLQTALAPLFLMLLGALFLGEPLTRRRIAGFAVAVAGLAVIASTRRLGGPTGYAGLLAVLALAPLSWSIHSALSKPVTRTVSPLVWTFLVLAVGGAPLLALAPFAGGREMLALDAVGWSALLFLTVGCTLLGFVMWSELLRLLPASTVGFSVFLNPPLTTLSKLALAAAAPSLFHFAVAPREALGGALALLGLAIAVAPVGGRRAARASPPRDQ